MNMRGLIVLVALACAVSSAARAHGIAGNRLFPGTLSFDDPAVADELVGPVFSRQKHLDVFGNNVFDETISSAITRLVVSRLAITADSAWSVHDGGNAHDVSGFGPTHIGIKGLAYEDDAHETLLSASLVYGTSGLGNSALHDLPFATLSPGVFFGQGLGALPQRMSALRPFGISGAVVVDFPLSGRSRPRGASTTSTNPIVLHTGISLQFSTYYLSDRFNGGPPKGEPLDQFVPLVEIVFDTPLSGGFGHKSAGTINPGVAYAGETYQISMEALVPVNRLGGTSVGFRVGAFFFLDDLVPALFGRPILH
jgi:hypothetical protein